jgi:hypothetical protein
VSARAHEDLPQTWEGLGGITVAAATAAATTAASPVPDHKFVIVRFSKSFNPGLDLLPRPPSTSHSFSAPFFRKCKPVLHLPAESNNLAPAARHHAPSSRARRCGRPRSFWHAAKRVSTVDIAEVSMHSVCREQRLLNGGDMISYHLHEPLRNILSERFEISCYWQRQRLNTKQQTRSGSPAAVSQGSASELS